jgi:hypothetical protein
MTKARIDSRRYMNKISFKELSLPHPEIAHHSQKKLKKIQEIVKKVFCEKTLMRMWI